MIKKTLDIKQTLGLFLLLVYFLKGYCCIFVREHAEVILLNMSPGVL